jgi:hypothetical protein
MFNLKFNTTTKKVKVSYFENGLFTSHNFENISTVKTENGYYELMQKTDEKTRPVLRVPITNTIMFLEV